MVALTPPDRVAAVRGDDEIARAASQLVDSLVREAATETTDVLRLAEQRHALRSRARARAQVELERRNRHRPDILVLDDVDEPSETPEAHRWGSLLRRALQSAAAAVPELHSSQASAERTTGPCSEVCSLCEGAKRGPLSSGRRVVGWAWCPRCRGSGFEQLAQR